MNSQSTSLFGFNKWELQSVLYVLLALGKLNINHLIMLRRVKFYRHLLHSCDVFLCDVFLMFLDNNFKSDCVLLGLCFYLRAMLSKVFGRPLRTMSLYNCYLLCVLTNCILQFVSVCLSASLTNKRVHNAQTAW